MLRANDCLRLPGILTTRASPYALFLRERLLRQFPRIAIAGSSISENNPSRQSDD
jgi:hypothetical protein